MSAHKKPLRIGNCSGYYGDWLGAARQLVESGNIDVLTGDFLAELTMSYLKDVQAGGRGRGHASTFLKQFSEIAKFCQDKGIKIVVNAGGLNPEGMADEVKALVAKLAPGLKVAYLDGDNLKPRMQDLQAAGESFTHMDDGIPLAEALGDPDTEVATANVYLGGWGIAKALEEGADIVICPRVTDAALVIGPVANHFELKRDDWNFLAATLAAGHIAECGTQATGGNFSGFQNVPSFGKMGYPIIEMHEDGSFIVTKPEGTDGMVSVDTVKAQLLYEIQKQLYLNPDVTLDLTSIELEQDGPNRVRVKGCKGSAPPPEHKVCISLSTIEPKVESLTDKFTAVVEVGLAGLDRKEKAELFVEQLRSRADGFGKFDSVEAEVIGDPDGTYQTLRITAKSQDEKLCQAFKQAANGLLLSTYPGCFFPQTVSFSSGRRYTHWPAFVGSEHVKQTVHVNDQVIDVLPTQSLGLSDVAGKPANTDVPQWTEEADEEYVEIPLGRVLRTRSGDKGGNANLGIWVPEDLDADDAKELYAYLCHYLAPEQLRNLAPDVFHNFEIERYEFPNLNAVSFRVLGILGQGVASSNLTDPQAKALGEVVGAAKIRVPKRLLSPKALRSLGHQPDVLQAGLLEIPHEPGPF